MGRRIVLPNEVSSICLLAGFANEVESHCAPSVRDRGEPPRGTQPALSLPTREEDRQSSDFGAAPTSVKRNASSVWMESNSVQHRHPRFNAAGYSPNGRDPPESGRRLSSKLVAAGEEDLPAVWCPTDDLHPLLARDPKQQSSGSSARWDHVECRRFVFRRRGGVDAGKGQPETIGREFEALVVIARKGGAMQHFLVLRFEIHSDDLSEPIIVSGLPGVEHCFPIGRPSAVARPAIRQLVCTHEGNRFAARYVDPKQRSVLRHEQVRPSGDQRRYRSPVPTVKIAVRMAGRSRRSPPDSSDRITMVPCSR